MRSTRGSPGAEYAKEAPVPGQWRSVIFARRHICKVGRDFLGVGFAKRWGCRGAVLSHSAVFGFGAHCLMCRTAAQRSKRGTLRRGFCSACHSHHRAVRNRNVALGADVVPSKELQRGVLMEDLARRALEVPARSQPRQRGDAGLRAISHDH